MKRRSQNGFTLVELLVVMVIMLVLFAFALPVLFSSIRKAKEKAAGYTVESIELAMKGYYDTYNEWRPGLSDGLVDMNLVRMLQGENPNDLNPQEKRFLEVNYSQLNSTGYMDPWGRPYRYTVDADYDGSIIHDGEAIHIVVGICSTGADPEDPTDDIWSWN